MENAFISSHVRHAKYKMHLFAFGFPMRAPSSNMDAVSVAVTRVRRYVCVLFV